MRLDNPDNNTRSGASSSSPPLHAEVRASVLPQLRQCLLDLLSEYQNSEKPMSEELLKLFIENKEDAILQAVADALLAAAKAEKWPEHANMTNTEQSPTPNWIFGYNSGVDAVTRVIGELGGVINKKGTPA